MAAADSQAWVSSGRVLPEGPTAAHSAQPNGTERAESQPVLAIVAARGDIFSIDRRSQGAYRHICLIGSGGIQR